MQARISLFYTKNIFINALVRGARTKALDGVVYAIQPFGTSCPSCSGFIIPDAYRRVFNPE